MKEIQLTQGKVALVDDEDFEALSQYKWHAIKSCNTFYAVRTIGSSDKRIKLPMHGVLMGDKWIDHIDGNGLNNQKSNLRFCTNQENQMNRRKQASTTSIYKGVSLCKSTGRWHAQIHINKKTINLGYFASEADAARAYNQKAIELFCEFANLNIIQ